MLGKVLIAIGCTVGAVLVIGGATFGYALYQWFRDPHGLGVEPEDYGPTADYPSERPTSGGLSGDSEDPTALIRPGL